MRESTALVAAIYEAFGRGDIEFVLSQLHPEIEWITPLDLPWAIGCYRGPAGVQRYFESFQAALIEPAIAPEDYITEGARVVAFGVERARARATGKAFATRFAHAFALRDGKVVRFEGFVDTASVLSAFAGAR